MRLADALSIFFVAFAYSQWAIVGRYTGAPGIWVGIVVMVTATTIMAGISWHEVVSAPLPPWPMIGLLVFAGVLNGIAIVVQTGILADRTLTVSSGVVLTALSAIMLTITPLLSYLINGDGISLLQAGGIALILAGVIVMAL